MIRKYTWGLDLAGMGGVGILPGGVGMGGVGVSPAKLEGAGGIGGLLATKDLADPNDPTDNLNYVYLYDANGNVGQVVDLYPGAAKGEEQFDLECQKRSEGT